MYKQYLRGLRPLVENASDVKVDLDSFKCIRDKNLPWDNLPKIKHDQRFIDLGSLLSPLIKNGRFTSPLEIISYLEDLKGFSLQENLQIQRFCLRLHLFFQLKTLNPFVYTWDYYLVSNLTYGPEFAQFLSKLRSALFIKSLSSIPLKKNNSFIERYTSGDGKFTPVKVDKVDYDSILNERFLIDFEETANDFPWAFKPVEEDQETLDKFREFCNHLLLQYKVEIKPPDREVFSTWINDSITQTDIGPKINRVLMRELDENQINELVTPRSTPSPLKFTRSVVSIDPANCRDTWQCHPDTLFVVKRVSYLLKQVLQPIPYSMMCDPQTAYHRRKVLKKKGHFLMFDYKKCGLTVNRSLIKIMAEELIKIYPNLGFEEMLSYSDITVYEGKVAHRPVRGVGLGNCNEGITLLQCVVGHIIKCGQETDSIFFNDDGVFYKETNPIRSFNSIITLLVRLGMIVNLEKTIISQSNIFCEDYVVTEGMDYSKKQLRILNYADIFFKQNISTAKALFNSLERESLIYGIKVNILNSLIQSYGIEFHEFEIFLPYELGGWRYIGRTSVNEVIRFIFYPKEYIPLEGRGLIPYMRRWIYYLIIAINAKRDFLSRKNIRFRRFVENPLKDPKLNHPQSDYARELYSILGMQNHNQNIRTLDDLYNVRGSHNSKPKLLYGLGNKLLLSRQRLWKKFTRSRETPCFQKLGGHLKMILQYLRDNEHIASNYLPPDFLIAKFEPVQEKLNSLGRVSFSKLKLLGRSSLLGTNQMAESLLSKKFLKGSEIFSLRDNLAKNRPASVISPSRMFYRKGQIYPLYLYYFTSDPRTIQSIYLQISGDRKLIPTGFNEWDFPSAEIKLILDPLGSLFPKFNKEINTIISLAKKGNATRLLEDFLSKRTDIEKILPILPEIFPLVIEQSKKKEILQIPDPSFEVDMELTLEVAGEPENLDELLELAGSDYLDPGEPTLSQEDFLDDEFIENPDDTLLFNLKVEDQDPEYEF